MTTTPSSPSSPSSPALELPAVPRGLRPWARATQGVLALWLLLFAVGAGVSLVQRDLLTRLRDDPASVRAADVLTSDDQVHVLNWTAFGLLVLTVAVWLVWWTLAYRAAEQTRGNLRYRRGWAIGGWFVPFANLVVPKRVTDDLWTASVEPDWPRDQESRSSWLVLGWWTSCILSVVIAALGERDPDTVDEAMTRNGVLLARTVAIAVAAVLAIRLVGRITAGFAAQAAHPVDAAAAEPSTPEPTPTPTRRPVVVGMAALVVVVVVGIAAASRALLAVDAHSTCSAAHRVAPAAHHFSLEVPCNWYVQDRSALSSAVAFDAVRTADGAEVTVIEAAAAGPPDIEAVQAGVASKLDVVGEIEPGTADLPAGHALTLSLTAMNDDDTLYDGRAYVFEGDGVNVMVLLSVASDKADASRAELDRILQSLRIDR